MARTQWNVDILVGSNFVFDGTIHAPNADFEVPRESTQTRSQLADGSDAFVFPETKSNKRPIKFIWEDVDKTFVDQIDGYIENGDFLRITDHNAVEYFGRFIMHRPVWITGRVDSYDIEVTFEQIVDPTL